MKMWYVKMSLFCDALTLIRLKYTNKGPQIELFQLLLCHALT